MKLNGLVRSKLPQERHFMQGYINSDLIQAKGEHL